MRSFSQLFKSFCGAFLVSLLIQTAFAEQYPEPPEGNSLIGNITYTSANNGETLLNIGERYNLGVNSMNDANPAWGENNPLPPGTYVKIPAGFILPPLPRRGIVINLSEMRMYYYPGNNEVMTFPIGIGKIGKTIPTGGTAVTRKVVNPTWIPPEDIRAFNRDQGIELPYAMGPGPDNPLGPYAIYLRVPTFLIHSTIFPESIGRRASFGCIRMNESDIKQFFPLVQAGTPVAIVDIPTKAGWYGNNLYLESHPALEEKGEEGLNDIVNTVERSLPRDNTTMVNWQLIAYLADLRDGVPHEVGFRIN